MSLLDRIIGSMLRPIAERQVRGQSLTELGQAFERSAGEVTAKLEAAPDTPNNREVAHHIIGIERWGQSRLRVALGEPFVLDRYRAHRMPDDTSMEELRAGFAATRQDTIALVKELVAADVDPSMKVRHNGLGELSLRAWLGYLDGHATREVKGIKD